MSNYTKEQLEAMQKAAPDMLCELQNSIVAIEKARDFLSDNKDKLNCDDVIATLTIRIINNEHVIAKAKGENQ